MCNEEELLSASESIKVNLYLFGMIGVFVFLTLIAFLCTDGRSYCVLPIMRRCCPSANWDLGDEDVDLEKLFAEVELGQHVFGVKRMTRPTNERSIIRLPSGDIVTSNKREYRMNVHLKEEK